MAIDASIGPVPPLTAPASGSGRPSRRWLTGGILVRSVGNRPAQPALTYAPVTRLRPCCLFRSAANSPESLSHAGAFARHQRNVKAARDASHGQDSAIAASTGLVQAAPTQAPVRLTSPALAEGRHVSLVSWQSPGSACIDLRHAAISGHAVCSVRPPTHQKHCLTLARSPYTLLRLPRMRQHRGLSRL